MKIPPETVSSTDSFWLEGMTRGFVTTYNWLEEVDLTEGSTKEMFLFFVSVWISENSEMWVVLIALVKAQIAKVQSLLQADIKILFELQKKNT